MTSFVPQFVLESGGAVRPFWSILNHPTPEPSQLANVEAHLKSQTMTGPWACVHCDQIAVMGWPAVMVALRGAEVPPLQRMEGEETEVMGS